MSNARYENASLNFTCHGAEAKLLWPGWGVHFRENFNSVLIYTINVFKFLKS